MLTWHQMFKEMGQIALMRLCKYDNNYIQYKICCLEKLLLSNLAIANEKCLFPWGKGWSLWGLITTNGENKNYTPYT